LQALSNLVDLGLNPQQALDMPRFCLEVNAGGGVGAQDPGGEVFLEKGFSFDEMATLRQKGHRVSQVSGRARALFGGGQILTRDPESGVIVGGSDARKDGCAMGY
jgi:gamma-glutamyltranspeptidase/glutathione hydrolase